VKNCREGGTSQERTPYLMCRIWFMILSKPFRQVQERIFGFGFFFFSLGKNYGLSMALLFGFCSHGRFCCFRCISFIKSSKGQLKQGEAFRFPTHTPHKIKLFLYKWCFTTEKLKDASRTDTGYFFLLLCFSKVHDIWIF